ncbi:MAG: adenylosuccinate synthase [Bacteroidia bacterium]|nr:adenylosuccinate synthase [Bacteroidia bacterium]MDW8157907.1 adenylosuccinate synthase [Bacteroidia bacterium]
MPLDILLGLQWGDEGKGKIIDVIAPQYEIVARYQGGPNAGHTVYYQNQKFVLHQIPSGVFHPHIQCVIGNGVVLNPLLLKQEVETLIAHGCNIQEKLFLSDSAHLILPTHVYLDNLEEQNRGSAAIGSTKRGIGPAYQDKIARKGLRLGDCLQNSFEKKFLQACKIHNDILKKSGHPTASEAECQAYLEAINELKKYPIIDTSAYLIAALKKNKFILAEGAQGFGLDIDHGSYPYVTSSNTSAGGACTGLGVPPGAIRKVIGISKAYATRVGNGPFPTEQNNSIGDVLRKRGQEYGATTGRPRRCGWLDLVALQRAIDINGVTEIIFTKLDVLQNLEEILVAIAYQEIPYSFTEKALSSSPQPVYIQFHSWQKNDLDDPHLSFFLQEIEKRIGIPISYVSIGPEREQILSYNYF